MWGWGSETSRQCERSTQIFCFFWVSLKNKFWNLLTPILDKRTTTMTTTGDRGEKTQKRRNGREGGRGGGEGAGQRLGRTSQGNEKEDEAKMCFSPFEKIHRLFFFLLPCAFAPSSVHTAAHRPRPPPQVAPGSGGVSCAVMSSSSSRARVFL